MDMSHRSLTFRSLTKKKQYKLITRKIQCFRNQEEVLKL